MTLQELGELLTSPPAGITVALADESDIYKWKVTMEGPVDSPYVVSDWQIILHPAFPLLFRRPSRQSGICFLLASCLPMRTSQSAEKNRSLRPAPFLLDSDLLEKNATTPPNPPSSTSSKHFPLTSQTRAESFTSSSTSPHNTPSALRL
jgi:hypothetical protein